MNFRKKRYTMLFVQGVQKLFIGRTDHFPELEVNLQNFQGVYEKCVCNPSGNFLQTLFVHGSSGVILEIVYTVIVLK